MDQLKQAWANRGTAAHIPCKICGLPTLMRGTELCDNCYEVTLRLADFLGCENGRQFAEQSLREGDSNEQTETET